MASYDVGYEDERFQSTVSANFHCPICLNVLREPVMCQNNQHYFCRPCISRHLVHSESCPNCKEDLTLETLSEAPRILKNCLMELYIRCDYFSRGCLQFVELGDLGSHVDDCGFSPVVCSNEGCSIEVNKRDRAHHESEVCELRKVKCHDCSELRKNIEKMALNMTVMKDTLTVLGDMKDNFEVGVRDIKAKADQQAFALDELRCKLETQDEILREVQDLNNQKRNIVIAGGRKTNHSELRTVEMLQWSTKTWSPLRPMEKARVGASSFVYNNTIVVTGGNTNHGATRSIDVMEINRSIRQQTWAEYSNVLPRSLFGHSTVVRGRKLIMTGGYNYDDSQCSNRVHELIIETKAGKLLSRIPQGRCFHGAELFDDQMLIFGGSTNRSSGQVLNSVLKYDISEKTFEEMPALPFAVQEMASVRWGDNVILFGGASTDGRALDTVVIYNSKTGRYHFLPPMKHKRKACAAVVVANCIVVMAGKDEQGVCLNSVEVFNFSDYSWKDLPSMNEARSRATAVSW